MEKGQLNQEFLKFCRLFLKKDLIKMAAESLDQFSVESSSEK